MPMWSCFWTVYCHDSSPVTLCVARKDDICLTDVNQKSSLNVLLCL